MLAHGRSTIGPSDDRALRPSVRRRPVHRRQRHGGARDPRRPAGRRRDRRAARRRRSARRHRAVPPPISARARGSSPPNRKPRRRWPRRSRPGGRSTSRTGRPSFVDGAGGKSVLETMWPLLAALAGSIVVSLDDVARGDALVAERAHVDRRRRRRLRRRRGAQRRRRGQAKSSPSSRAAISIFRSSRRSSAHVDDHPIINPDRQSSMNRYADPAASARAHLPSRRARRRSLVELAPRRRDRCSAASTTRSGGRPRTTRCGCCGSIPRAKLERPRPSQQIPRALRPRDRRARRLRARATNTWWASRFPAPRRADRSRTSRPSSRCISRCRSTPAASACSPAITARKRATSACRSIGVGFMYPQGYFHQHVSAEGWQEESYERLNWADAPIEPALTPDGKPCITRGAARRSHRCWSRSGACGSAA